MPLTFVDKKKRWPPPKPVQYALAVLALLLAVALLGGWLYLQFIYTAPTAPDADSSDTTSPTGTELPDVAHCLIIIEDVGYERFALVKADPTNDAISISAISPTLETDAGVLSAILQKYGAARVTQAVASTLNVPVSNYLSFSIADVQNLFTKLGENLQCTLSEEVTYRDENGATVRLAAEKRALTPKQIAAVLRHTEWTTAENGINMAADLTAAVINQCLRPGSSLKGYFALLSNTASTNLRIDHFNGYLIGLEHLASVNVAEKGDVAHCVDLS